MTKRLLFLLRHRPGPHARETLDTALVSAVFDQPVTLLFREAGVLQLTESDEVPSELTESLRSLSDYGIDAVYVCADSLERCALDVQSLVLPVSVLTISEQSELLAAQDMVVPD